MFLSLKAGEGNKDSEGRFFQYYDESSVEALYKDDLRLELHKMWRSTSLVLDDSGQTEWLNLLLMRKPKPY